MMQKCVELINKKQYNEALKTLNYKLSGTKIDES